MNSDILTVIQNSLQSVLIARGSKLFITNHLFDTSYNRFSRRFLASRHFFSRAEYLYSPRAEQLILVYVSR